MPVIFENDVARFEGQCAVEEADALSAWASDHPKAQVDLAKLEHLHAALLQVLLVFRPTVIAPPSDPFLAALTPWAHTRICLEP